jgi:hypothetical protein
VNWKLLIAGAAAAAALASQAQALDFTFVFDSDLNLGDATIVPGQAIGTIIGLQDNTFDQQASDVQVTFVSPGVLDLPPTPFSLFDYASFLAVDLHQPDIDVHQNDFDVQNGQIVGGVFQIFGGYFDLNVGGHFNSMVSPDSLTRIQNLGGLGGVEFFPAPEPATWSLMLLGFGGLGALLRTRRRRTALAA